MILPDLIRQANFILAWELTWCKQINAKLRWTDSEWTRCFPPRNWQIESWSHGVMGLKWIWSLIISWWSSEVVWETVPIQLIKRLCRPSSGLACWLAARTWNVGSSIWRWNLCSHLSRRRDYCRSKPSRLPSCRIPFSSRSRLSFLRPWPEVEWISAVKESDLTVHMDETPVYGRPKAVWIATFMIVDTITNTIHLFHLRKGYRGNQAYHKRRNFNDQTSHLSLLCRWTQMDLWASLDTWPVMEALYEDFRRDKQYFAQIDGKRELFQNIRRLTSFILCWQKARINKLIDVDLSVGSHLKDKALYSDVCAGHAHLSWSFYADEVIPDAGDGFGSGRYIPGRFWAGLPESQIIPEGTIWFIWSAAVLRRRTFGSSKANESLA